MRKLATHPLAFVIPALVAASLGLAGCSPAGSEAPAMKEEATAVPAPGAEPDRIAREASPQDEGPRVVFLGDSLTAGLGLPEGQAFPALVERRLEEKGVPLQVVNAGVSGDTTAGGLARLDWLLDQRPDVVVVGLGANDGLRGLPLAETEKNLREIVRRSREAGARVLLLGMKIPPNYGPDYAGGFEAIYPRIAEDLDVPVVPFLLEGVGGVLDLNQADGIHPTAEGQERVAENVAPALARLLGQAEG